MKTAHVILIILGALVFLMLGCFLFFGVFIGLSAVEDVFKDIERMYEHRVIAGLFGFIFISIGYIAVKNLIKLSNKDEIFVVENEHGRTSISILAVEHLIRKTLRKHTNIKRYRIRVRSLKQVLNIRVNLILFMDKSASAIVEEVQREIQRKLITFVGLRSEHMDVTVKVDKVVERKPTKAAKPDDSKPAFLS